MQKVLVTSTKQLIVPWLELLGFPRFAACEKYFQNGTGSLKSGAEQGLSALLRLGWRRLGTSGKVVRGRFRGGDGAPVGPASEAERFWGVLNMPAYIDICPLYIGAYMRIYLVCGLSATGTERIDARTLMRRLLEFAKMQV